MSRKRTHGLENDIFKLIFQVSSGEGFYKGLSQDLQDIFPSVKGFSVRNLQYMKQMYEVFSKESIFMPQVVAQYKGYPQRGNHATDCGAIYKR